MPKHHQPRFLLSASAAMTEDLRARMMSLNLPSAAAPGPPGGSSGVGGNNSDLSPDFGFSSVSSTPAGSLSARPARDERSESA